MAIKAKIDFQKVPRNRVCPCGSGKKYKRCCMNRRNNHKHRMEGLALDIQVLSKTKKEVTQEDLYKLQVKWGLVHSTRVSQDDDSPIPERKKPNGTTKRTFN